MPNGEEMNDRLEDAPATINRREAIWRVGLLLGGVTFIGGTSLLTACEKGHQPVASGANVGEFTPDDMAFLDEVADTILPATKTPGAKDAKVGPFIAVMVTDCYDAKEQKIFRDGMKKLDDASKKANNNASFVSSTPEQRLALLVALDKEAKSYSDAVETARNRKPSDTTTSTAEKKAQAQLPDQRKEGGLGADVGTATAITADSPPHYFRMLKELTMLGYFTSEIGCKQAQRYVESPGRYDPCVPYKKGDKAWAPHA